MEIVKKELKDYLAKIGSKGGRTSRRKITPEQQAAMQEARKSKRLSQGTNVSDQIPRTQDAANTTDSPERLSASVLFALGLSWWFTC